MRPRSRSGSEHNRRPPAARPDDSSHPVHAGQPIGSVHFASGADWSCNCCTTDGSSAYHPTSLTIGGNSHLQCPGDHGRCLAHGGISQRHAEIHGPHGRQKLAFFGPPAPVHAVAQPQFAGQSAQRFAPRVQTADRDPIRCQRLGTRRRRWRSALCPHACSAGCGRRRPIRNRVLPALARNGHVAVDLRHHTTGQIRAGL